jgi:ectoine hydroxylase-related dioxygenase (phytanoyl-CoA dioxygenase family)
MDGFDASLNAAHWTAALQRDGYCIIPHAIDPGSAERLHGDLRERFARTPFCEGDFYGTRTKRFGGLLKRSREAEQFVMHPTILSIARAVLGPFCDRIQLNLTQALEIHPGEVRQAPHRDQDMWQGPTGKIEYLVNIMWPFTQYTRENGATILYPGTHKVEPGTPQSNQAIYAEMEPGDALLFLGSVLHGAGANRTDAPRSGMIVSYSLGWLKPYENQWLAYPPEIARQFSPELAALAGYEIHRPNLGNYEGQCPSVLLRGANADDYLPAVDVVRPHQVEQLAMFKALQRSLAGGT